MQACGITEATWATKQQRRRSCNILTYLGKRNVLFAQNRWSRILVKFWSLNKQITKMKFRSHSVLEALSRVREILARVIGSSIRYYLGTFRLVCVNSQLSPVASVVFLHTQLHRSNHQDGGWLRLVSIFLWWKDTFRCCHLLGVEGGPLLLCCSRVLAVPAVSWCRPFWSISSYQMALGVCLSWVGEILFICGQSLVGTWVMTIGRGPTLIKQCKIDTVFAVFSAASALP